MTAYDRDTLLKLALSPDEQVRAPADLGDAIYRTVIDTPQRRPLARLAPQRWVSQRWLPSMSPAFVLLLLLALLLAGVAAFALSRPPYVPLLTMYHGGPDRTGVMPGPAPLGEPFLDWEAQRNGAIRFTIMPIVSGGRVFVSDDSGGLAALDEATGTALWEADVGSPIRASSVLVGDLLVVAGEDGAVVAFAAADGQRRWAATVEGPISASLAEVAGRIYVGSESGSMSILDAATGRDLGSIEVGGPLTRGPAVAGGTLYAGTADGLVVAIELASRRERWRRADLRPNGFSTPSVVDEVVYIGHGLEDDVANAELLALDSRTGRDVWTFPLPEAGQIHVGAVDAERVYAVSTDTNVYALERSTGKVVWTFTTRSPNGALAGLVGTTLFVSTSDGVVHAIDAESGSPRWSFQVDGDLTMPVVINGRVIVGTSLGRVVAIGGSASP